MDELQIMCSHAHGVIIAIEMRRTMWTDELSMWCLWQLSECTIKLLWFHYVSWMLANYHEWVSRCCFQKRWQIARLRCLKLPEVATDWKMQIFCGIHKWWQMARCNFFVASRSCNRLSDACACIMFHLEVWADYHVQVSTTSTVGRWWTQWVFFGHGSSYCYSWWMWWGFDTFGVTLTRRLWVLTMLMIMIVLWVFQSIMVVVKSLIYIYWLHVQ
jgi:hypothetical protein